MQTRHDTDRTTAQTADFRVRPEVEARSWAPRAPQPDWGWDTSEARPTFTHNAARYARPNEAVAPVERVDLEPELSPPPRWMMALAGAAVAALMGALLGGFMQI